MPKTPKRILLYRLGSLGDHLIAFPCYKLARRAFPGAETCLLTNIPIAAKAAAAETVLSGSGLVDQYITYVVGERGPLALLKLILRIRAYGADALVYLAGARGLEPTKRDKIFFRVCGIKRQIGLPLTEDLQNHRSLGTDAAGTPWYESEASRLARCVAELGDAQLEEAASWSPNITDAENAEVASFLEELAGKPFFSFSIGAKAQANHWGAENWRALLGAVSAEHPGHGLVITGAPDETEVSETIAEAWRAQGNMALNLCGKCKPRPSAALLQHARMHFGHDSGPMHLSASVDIPLLGIFSARHKAGQWYPRGTHSRILMHWVDCGGCLLETCTVQGKKCILSIGVEEALVATREHLAHYPLKG